MTPGLAALLFFSAMLGGAINSVAGGGTLVTFPALVHSGVIEKLANTTSTVALWPGSVASAGAYRRELAAHRHELVLFGCMSLIGGLIGALTLLRTSAAGFRLVLPYLILAATLLFVFGPVVTKKLQARRSDPAVNGRAGGPSADSPSGSPARQRASVWRLVGAALLQLGTAVYGGYFGAGIGFLMLATLSLLGMEDIHAMNALKTILGSLINGVAVVMFIVTRQVMWHQAGVMLCGAIVGGYLGAHYARQVRPALVRQLVAGLGFALTAYFFGRAYL